MTQLFRMGITGKPMSFQTMILNGKRRISRKMDLAGKTRLAYKKNGHQTFNIFYSTTILLLCTEFSDTIFNW